MMNRSDAVAVLFYDLPTITPHDKKSYRKFNKFLIGEGYFMFQESVYIKYLHNSKMKSSELTKIRKASPVIGKVNLLFLNYKAFRSMITITGEPYDFSAFSDPVLLI